MTDSGYKTPEVPAQNNYIGNTDLINEGGDIYANSTFDVLHLTRTGMDASDVDCNLYRIVNPDSPGEGSVDIDFSGNPDTGSLPNTDPQALMVILMDHLKKKEENGRNEHIREATHHLALALDFLNNAEE